MAHFGMQKGTRNEILKLKNRKWYQPSQVSSKIGGGRKQNLQKPQRLLHLSDSLQEPGRCLIKPRVHLQSRLPREAEAWTDLKPSLLVLSCPTWLLKVTRQGGFWAPKALPTAALVFSRKQNNASPSEGNFQAHLIKWKNQEVTHFGSCGADESWAGPSCKARLPRSYSYLQDWGAQGHRAVTPRLLLWQVSACQAGRSPQRVSVSDVQLSLAFHSSGVCLM